jgi:acyl-CoA thioester hydrolase
MHTFPIRIYYEDTDSGGVVYYANYLKFAERARTELLREKSIEQNKLDGYFVVRRVETDFISPAKLDDLIAVHTQISEIKGASLIMNQEIKLDDKLLVKLTVQIVWVDKNFKPAKIPKDVLYQSLANNN